MISILLLLLLGNFIPNSHGFLQQPRIIESRPVHTLVQKRQVSVNPPSCITPKGEQGHCSLVRSCPLENLGTNVKLFEYICITDSNVLGICCPLTNAGHDFLKNRAQTPLTLPERGCGTTTRKFPKVDDSRAAEAGEWPWMAAIFRRKFPNIHCGGALFTDQLVLTAAHCTHNVGLDELTVRLGEYDLRTFNETRLREFRVIRIQQHHDYDPSTYENDIAILKLDRPTIFNTYIWPICLPPINETWADWTGIVLGWGTKYFSGPYSKILMEVSVPIWRLESCQELYVETISESSLCAGEMEGGRDSCQGDSGGPLTVQLENGRWVLVGLVSWGIRCGEKSHPGIYTRVNKFLPWILRNYDI